VNKRVITGSEIVYLIGASSIAIALLFMIGIFGLTMPRVLALQQNGIQKNATIHQKLPYRGVCSGTKCKEHVLRMGFQKGQSETVDIREIQFANLTVSQAEYAQASVGQTIRVVYLENNPEEIWTTQSTLGWTPWTGMLWAAAGVLLGLVLLLISKRMKGSTR
jgi:hypothetical protein